MLRKRSRVVSSKQGLMTDHLSLPSPSAKLNNPTTSCSLFTSTRPFVGFSPKGFSDSEAAMSPTSILETKPFSAFGNPFFSDKNPGKPLSEPHAATFNAENTHHPWDNGGSKAIGLGIVDALKDEEADMKYSCPDSRRVLFGSKLKIQIPSMHANNILSNGYMESPRSPIEFGIKTKNSQLALFTNVQRSGHLDTELRASSPRVFTGRLPTSEMELSEDYTCVISHGPNPKTTHIFDNCILECCRDGFSVLRGEHGSSKGNLGYPSDDFLSFCYACKKNLGQGTDIFMYRGDKAFCSHECRNQEMLIDEGGEKCSSDPSLSI